MKANEQSIAMLFEAVADRSIQFADNGVLQELTAAYARITTKAINGQLKDLWATAPDKHIYTITEVYENCMDFAFGKIMTGATDATTAMRQATRELANRGIRELPNGKSERSVSIEYATRRYILNRMGALHAEISQSNHDKMGADGWELSAHGGCAPDHEPCQGRQYSDKDYERLNAGLERKIGTWQCKHIAYPIILGKSKPNYTDAELQELIDRNAAGVTYEGKHYTLYEAEAQRNGLESAIRRDKLRCIVSEELGDKEQLFTDQLRLSLVEQEYVRFCHATGLRTQSQRLHVAGFGRAQATKKTWTVRKSANAQVLQQLTYLGDVPKAQRISIEKELSLLPEHIRAIAETRIAGIRFTEDPTGCKYDPSTSEIILSRYREEGAIIHEYAHALERALNLYNDPAFLSVLNKGLENITLDDILEDSESFTKPITRVLSRKFVYPYQGRLYEFYGIYDGKRIYLDGMREYFSEGMRAYYFDTELLRQRDPDLYTFIEELMK